jgi:hypothetical protein
VEDSGEDEVMGDGEGIVEDADESQAGNVDDDANMTWARRAIHNGLRSKRKRMLAMD